MCNLRPIKSIVKQLGLSQIIQASKIFGEFHFKILLLPKVNLWVFLLLIKRRGNCDREK